MYFVFSGTAEAIQDRGRGKQQVVYNYKENDYFGELALLDGNKRTASVRVTSDSLIVLSLSKKTFENLLGKLEDILKRNKQRYLEFQKHWKSK